MIISECMKFLVMAMYVLFSQTRKSRFTPSTLAWLPIL